MLQPVKNVGEMLTNAHNDLPNHAYVLAERMAKRAIRIANESPLDKDNRGSSLMATAYMALAAIEVRALHMRLIPIATTLIGNHGSGHKVHDMNPHFWKLGNDAALELVCECLSIHGKDEIVAYLQEESIRRHILHHPARLKLLDAGYTYTSAASGAEHDFDSIWKGHNTSHTLPAPENDETNNRENRKLTNSLVYIDKKGSVNPLIEADRIEDRGTYIIAYHSDKIVFHTKPRLRILPETQLTPDGNIDPDGIIAAFETRGKGLPTEALRNEYTCPKIIEITGMNTISSSEKVAGFTLFRLTNGISTHYVYIDEKKLENSFETI